MISNTTTLISLSIPAGLFVKGLIQDDSLSQRNAWILSATYFFNGAITASLKYFVNRPRPFDSYPEFFIKKSDGGSPSFPSGHTSIAFATATSLSLLYPKWYVILPSYLWAGSVAYSRMHLGVHYPSDVLAGAAIGVATAYISYKANRWLNKRYGY
ncbi:MAG: phosphatase PAP2 family protein [Bacteroidales bacterium]|nr:phosphatase PAP2 family protein [Bacteroidales bacterium]